MLASGTPFALERGRYLSGFGVGVGECMGSTFSSTEEGVAALRCIVDSRRRDERYTNHYEGYMVGSDVVGDGGKLWLQLMIEAIEQSMMNARMKLT